MPNKKYPSLSFVTLAVAFAVTAMPAYAGFEWVAPNDTAPRQLPPEVTYIPSPPPSMATSSVATNGPEIISPVVITGTGNTNAPSVDMAPATHVLPIPRSLPKPTEPAVKTDLATTTISIAPDAPADNVRGFASQIPLALAIRQIVPAGYDFSLDQDVDMNTLVSYKGGKPWRDTLRDALTPVGLTAHEQGLSVTVSRATEPVKMTPVADMALPAIAPAKNVTRDPYVVISSNNDQSMSASPATMQDNWTAQRGDTLHKVLKDWCARAGVELQWKAEYDYPVEGSAHFSSSFEDAVRNLLMGFDGARPQPIGELHTNTNAGQMVLVVQTRGNNYSN